MLIFMYDAGNCRKHTPAQPTASLTYPMVKLMSYFEGIAGNTNDPDSGIGETMSRIPVKSQKAEAGSFYLLDCALRVRLQTPHSEHKFVRAFA